MGLHHMVTIYLFVGSYMLNMWEVGSVISWLHDFSDVPINMTRVISNTVYKKTTAVIFTIAIITWIWVRNYTFTKLVIIWSNIEGPYGIKKFLKYIFVSLACCLIGLHYYWICLFLKMLGKYFIKGSTEDMQNKVEIEDKK